MDTPHTSVANVAPGLQIDDHGSGNNLLAYYDCLSNIAYGHIQRSNGTLSDTDFALLNQSYKEMMLLASKNQLLTENQEPLEAIDHYIIQKLGPLGRNFAQQRSKNQRLLFSINLCMREYCLNFVSRLLKIVQTLCIIKTPDTLQIWDQEFAKEFLNNISQLKQTFLLFDRFPVKLAFNVPSKHDEKQLSAYLGLHHAAKELSVDHYTSGKFQAFFLHNIAQSAQLLTKLYSDLPLPVSSGKLGKPSPVILDKVLFDTLLDSMTDLLITVVENSETSSMPYEETIAPTLAGMETVDQMLHNTLTVLEQLPRKKRAERSLPEGIQKSLKEDLRWLQYRQRALEHSKIL